VCEVAWELGVTDLHLAPAPGYQGRCPEFHSFGPTPEEGVIDGENKVKGYPNMIVCDGSQIPENLGVNPALSITAFAERAMSFVPQKKSVRVLAAEKRWGLDGLLLRGSGPSRGPLSPGP
jgi:hypothetical protein